MVAFYETNDNDLTEEQVSSLPFEEVQQYNYLTTTLHYEIYMEDRSIFGIKQSRVDLSEIRDYTDWLHTILDQKIQLMWEMTEKKIGWSFTDKQSFTFRFS